MELLIISWIFGGILNYGMTYAFFQREFPLVAEECKGEHRVPAVAMAIAGPFGFIAMMLLFSIYNRDGSRFSNPFRHGLKFR